MTNEKTNNNILETKIIRKLKKNDEEKKVVRFVSKLACLH
jgi:hypothetical protein